MSYTNDNQLAQTEEGHSVYFVRYLKYVEIVCEPVFPAHGVHPDRRLATCVHLTLARHWFSPRPCPHLYSGVAEDG